MPGTSPDVARLKAWALTDALHDRRELRFQPVIPNFVSYRRDVGLLSLTWEFGLPSVRFSGGLSPREHLPGKAADSPAHAHRRC